MESVDLEYSTLGWLPSSAFALVGDAEVLRKALSASSVHVCLLAGDKVWGGQHISLAA